MTNYDNHTVERALFVLEAVATAEAPISLTEISQKLEMSPSTALRHLRTLEKNGFVLSGEKKRYMPGYMVFRLGWSSAHRRSTIRLIQPVLEDVAREAVAIANLGAIEGRQVVCIEQTVPRPDTIVPVSIGARYDAHATALGKAILSQQSEEDVRALYRGHPLRQHTENTITNLDVLLAELEESRVRGYSIDDCEAVNGLACVAAPIVNSLGKADKAVSISAPALHLNAEERASLGPYLVGRLQDFVQRVVDRPFFSVAK